MEDLYQNGLHNTRSTKTAKLQYIYISGTLFFYLLFSAEGIRNEIYIAHVARFIYKEIYT